MLRGSQKRMIVVRTRDSRVFEEAYFVIRRDAEGRNGGETAESDMLREANRILENSRIGEDRSDHFRRRDGETAKRSLRGCLGFLAGLLTGSGVASLLWFLL